MFSKIITVILKNKLKQQIKILRQVAIVVGKIKKLVIDKTTDIIEFDFSLPIRWRHHWRQKSSRDAGIVLHKY